MTEASTPPETFAEFKDSFPYGSRTDLSFKFLKGLPDDAAATFMQGLLWKLGAAFDDGDYSRVYEHVRQAQIKVYSEPTHWKYDDAPFTPMRKPIAKSRLALVASSGHFVAGHDPKPFGIEDMTQAEAVRRIGEFVREPPVLTEVPCHTPHAQLRVRHGGYDIRGAEADPNVVFPVAHQVQLQHEGEIGELLPYAYAFVGAAAQQRLLRETGPRLVELLAQQRVEGALLVPA